MKVPEPEIIALFEAPEFDGEELGDIEDCAKADESINPLTAVVIRSFLSIGNLHEGFGKIAMFRDISRGMEKSTPSSDDNVSA
jgi:hypothetical protein